MLRKVVSAIALAGVVGSASACIFDTGGDYPGGGRKSQGFEEIEQDAGLPPEDQPGKQTGQDSGSNPFADAFGGGGGG